MNRKYVKGGLIACIGVLLLSLVCLLATAMPKAFAATIKYEEGGISEYYMLGETFVSPKAKLLIDGEETAYEANKQILYYPDGRAFSSDEYVLSNTGVYYLRYYADYKGNSVYGEDKFTVKGSLYTVSGNNSSAYYGTTDEKKGSIEGIIVDLVPGDTFTYSKPISLVGKTKSESIIKLFALPDRQGIADVRGYKIRLTDAMNASNYVEIYQYANIKDDNEVLGYALYCGISASNQSYFAGLHYTDDPDEDSVLYEGSYYNVHTNLTSNDERGYPSYAASLAASKGYGYKINEDGSISTSTHFRQPFSYSFDYRQKKIYGNPLYPDRTIGNNLIADLDDSLFFDTLWEGFTTGEVYLSIYSEDYINSSFSFVITEIYDEDLSQTSFVGSNTPEIRVNLPETENGKVPYAIVDTPYEVFSALAYSATDGIINCDTLVYQDYYSNSKKLCKIQDGKFTPSELNATYHIVYRATDSFGNTFEEAVQVNVVEKSDLELYLSEAVSDGYIGELTYLKQPAISGVNGKAVLNVTAVSETDGTEYPVLFEGDTYWFYSLKADTYKIKYVLTDYSAEVKDEYTLTIHPNPNAVYVSEPALPRVFVKGAEYVLPDVYGIKANDGKGIADQRATIKYSFDNGELNDYEYGSLLYIDADQSVEVVYSLVGALDEKVVTIPVTDVGLTNPDGAEYHNEKYFYSEEFTASVSEGGCTYSTKQPSAELYFVKPILAVDFNLRYHYTFANFHTMTVKYTDINDPENVLKIEILKKNDEKLLVSINDGVSREISSTVQGPDHTIIINVVTGTLKIDRYKFDISDFKGFTDNTCYLEIGYEGITDNLEVVIDKLGNILLSDQTSDYAKPLYYLDVNSGKKTIGDSIVIKGFYVEDVLRFGKEHRLSVLDPDGNNCYTVDGKEMRNITDFSREYEIKVEKYGKYTITGTCSDGSNNIKINIEINSYDEVAPVITITGEKHPAVYANETYEIPAATATDDIDGTCSVTIVVVDVEEKTTIVTDGKYKFTRAGKYRVMYIAEDKAHNVSFASYEIIAVEKGR